MDFLQFLVSLVDQPTKILPKPETTPTGAPKKNCATRRNGNGSVSVWNEFSAVFGSGMSVGKIRIEF